MVRGKKSNKTKIKKRIVKDRYKYKGLLLVLACFAFAVLGFLIYQGYVFYQFDLENERLTTLKEEYQKLLEEIDGYKQLKGQYEVILNEGSELDSNKDKLKKKVVELNNDISDLETKIADVNKKIKDLS